MALPKILQNSGLYSFVSFLQKGISFFLLPVYTAYLTKEDYGVLSVIQSIVSFLSIFLLLSFNAAASRFHFISSDKYRRARVWGTTLMLVIYNSVFLGGIFIVAHQWLIDPFAKGIPFFPLIFISLLGTILSPLYLFFQNWLQVTQQGTRFAINMTLNFLVATGFNIISLTVFNAGVYGLVFSAFLTSLLFFIYSFIAFLPHVNLKINKKITSKSLKYSLPLVPHSVSSWFMVMVDRIMINDLIGSAQTGLYSVAYQFGGIINIITTSVNQAFSPWFMEKVKVNREQLKPVYDFSELLTVGYCFLAMGVSFFSPEVIYLMTPQSYHEAWYPVIFISFGYVFGGVYYFFSMPLWLRKTKYVFVITFISSIVAIGLNYVLIPRIGIIGSGVALLASLFTSSLVGLILSKKAEKDINFPWKKIYSIVMLFFGISLSVFSIETLNVSIFLKIIIKLAIVAVLFLIFIYGYRSRLGIIKTFIKFKH